jgi:hypothetical protein
VRTVEMWGIGLMIDTRGSGTAFSPRSPTVASQVVRLDAPTGFRHPIFPCPRPLGREDARAGEGMDVAPVLRTIRSVAPHNVEDGQRIEIARMQQLLAERD